jgi:glycosyltransferase involved in cell wall biosynthesis
MHIVMVANTYLPVVNGVTVSVASWARVLRSAGHEVTVWTTATTAPDLPHVVATRGVGAVVSGFPFPASVRSPKGLLETADVVHLHHPVLLGRIALSSAKRRGLPVVATAHSDYLHYLESYAWQPTRPALYTAGGRMMRSTFNSCGAVMAPSESVAAKLELWGVTVPIVPVDYAVDASIVPDLSRAQARQRLGLEGRPLAFYAGRLAPEKGLKELVAEFRRVHDVLPEARLAIAGDGPSRSQLHEKFVAQGLDGAVLPLGLLSREELGLWYAAADLFVSASPSEVGPLTAIEAQLCGAPVVAYRGPGFEDRVVSGETGLLVAARSGALSSAMIDLLSDPALAAKLGANAEKAARSRYDSERVARRLLSVYDAVIR